MKDAPTRKFFIHFLEMCQKGNPVLIIDGEEVDNPPMTKEEADLRLAIFDGEIKMDEDINLKLAQFEAMRWPNSKKASARMWTAMEKVKG